MRPEAQIRKLIQHIADAAEATERRGLIAEAAGMLFAHDALCWALGDSMPLVDELIADMDACDGACVRQSQAAAGAAVN